MAIARSPLVIGLTGPFGSGCTTCSKMLRDQLGFTRVQVSTLLRREWAKAGGTGEPKRCELQKLGNQVRRDSKDPGALAARVIKDLDVAGETLDRVVIDGIRNAGEIERFRRRFGFEFFVFATDCSPSDRWERLESQYRDQGLSTEDFGADDRRDRNEDYSFGQQVIACMDKADVLVRNDGSTTLKQLREKLVDYVKLVSGERPRYATRHEMLMNVAYSSSHSSKCLKRQVGAVLADGHGRIIATGFNENPVGTLPCVETPEYRLDQRIVDSPGRCYRDIVRHESYMKHAEQGRRCPACGASIPAPASQSPPWRCACDANLDDYFWPERALSLCTAVHAEVAALHVAGPRAKEATLYTTTFPCFQCTEQIIHAGIRRIYFTEPYPDIRAAHRLDLAGISYERFEGVRSWRFDEIFSRARPYAETRQ